MSRITAIAMVWSGIALITIVQVVVRHWIAGDFQHLARNVFGSIAIIPLWALATPAILRGGERLRAGGITLRAVAEHLLRGSAFVIASNAVIRLPLLASGPASYAESLAVGLVMFYPLAMLAYGVVVAVGWFLAPAPKAHPEPQTPALLTVADRSRTYQIALGEIEWLEAEDNYVLVHTPTRSYTLRRSLAELEASLDAARFVRVHRSAIVNVDKVAEVRALTHGDFLVVLARGGSVRGSRTRRASLQEILAVRSASPANQFAPGALR